MKLKKLIKPGGFLYKPLVFTLIIFIKIWLKTLRVTKIDPENFNSDNPQLPVLAIFWHNRTLTIPSLFHKNIQKHAISIVSQSKDGQYSADFLASFGISSVRGSSSKSATKTLRQIVDLTQQKKIIALSPDGPRGPKYELKKGIAFAAMKTGTPVIPMSVNSSSCWQLKSWDNYQIPKPFSKITLKIGKHIYLEDNKELFDEHIQTLTQALMDITEDPI